MPGHRHGADHPLGGVEAECPTAASTIHLLEPEAVRCALLKHTPESAAPQTGQPVPPCPPPQASVAILSHRVACA